MNQSTVQSYKKKCKTCGVEIVMSNASSKWKALETDNATAHICKTGLERIPDLEKSPINEKPPARPVMQVDEITELKQRVTKLEDWIKRVSESWNQ